MRVKIRGLVFVGFAAAVFAQSAMADANDAKTVTSKLYVDSKIVATDATNNNATTIASNSPDDKAPSALNVYKFVTGQVEGAAITPAVGSPNGTDYLNFTKSGNTLTVDLDNAPATTAAELTGAIDGTTGLPAALTSPNDKKLVTAGAVNALVSPTNSNGTTISGSSTNGTVPTSKNVFAYAEAKANKLATSSGSETITAAATAQSNNTSDTTYPTVKNVYQFVTTQGGNFQPKVTTAATETMYIGKYVPDDPATTNVDETSATWDKLTTGTYVSNTSSTAGTYTLDVPAAKITSATSDFVASNDADASTKRPKLATAGAVYDFVKAEGGNYQPKIDNSNAGKIMIGFGEGSGATYSSDWKELIGASTDASSAVGYVTIKEPGSRTGVYEVNIAENMIAGSGSNIAAAATTGDGAAYMNDLTTALAVKQYVTGLTGGLTIPQPTGDCASTNMTSTNDTACALVLAYWTAAESPTGQADVGLKWVPMAQTVSSGL